MNYLAENSIFYRYLSGFGKNHSTDFSLSYLMDKVLTGVDSGPLTEIIFIDLLKAFNNINHDILLKKISALFSSHNKLVQIAPIKCKLLSKCSR